jgi:hypothetical protein
LIATVKQTCSFHFRLESSRTMKGVIFESQGADPKVVDDLEKPSPGPDQLLVKPIWSAINPVYARRPLLVSVSYIDRPAVTIT